MVVFTDLQQKLSGSRELQDMGVRTTVPTDPDIVHTVDRDAVV